MTPQFREIWLNDPMRTLRCSYMKVKHNARIPYGLTRQPRAFHSDFRLLTSDFLFVYSVQKASKRRGSYGANGEDRRVAPRLFGAPAKLVGTCFNMRVF